jgi:hypothetical protein
MSDPFADLSDIGDESEDSVGLSPEDKKHGKSNKDEWFKGEAGRTYRVHLLYFWPLVKSAARAAQRKAKAEGQTLTKEQLTEIAKKALLKRAEELGRPADQLADHEKLDTNEVRFEKVLYHYKDGFGYAKSRLGLDGDSADEVWKALGEQQKCFTTLLLIYPTNREGELEREEVLKKWTILPWRLSPTNYNQLHQANDGLRANDLTIANQDLVLSFAKKKTFVVLDKVTTGGKALWRKNDKFAATVLEKSCTMYDKLQPFREMSTADVRIKLGLADSKGDDMSSDDMEDLLSKA